MKRLLYILIFALLFGTAMAVQPYHEVDIVDERGVLVTDISSVEIYAPDTTTNAVIYSDRTEQNTITIPMTTGSTNTTLSGGQMSWYGPDGYDFSITDGTNIATNANHRTRTSSEGTIVFPSYLTSITTSQYLDAESITMGTSSDWVLNAGATADLLTWTPASDGAIFRIGANDAATNGDFRVQVGTDLGFYIDEGVPSFSWTGGAASINASSNFNTTINTGTSTGTVTLGSSTAGALTLDTTSTYTLSSDGAHSTTTTDASADITVDATLGSVIIDGGEAVDDAVTIRSTGAAGGIDITSLGDIDITTTGAAGEDINITNTGGTIAVTATENIQNVVHLEENGGTSGSVNIYSNQGTGVSASTEHDASVQLHSDDGGISLYTTANLANAVRVETNGGTSETIVINNVQGTGAAAVTIAANAAGGDVNIDSVLGRIEIEAEEDVANALYLIADGGTSTTLEIFNDTGTSVTEGAASIEILSDVGGVEIQSNANLDDALVLRVDGGTTSEILVHNDQGNTSDSIQLISDAGGVTITAGTQITTGGGLINGSVQDIAAGGTTTAIALTNTVATVGADAGGDIVTLANGTAGQIMYIICEDATGTTTVTPATFNGGTSITFDAVGDSITLVYGTDLGWAIVGGNSYTII